VRSRWQVEPVERALAGTRHLVGLVGATDSEAAAGLVKGVEDSLGPVHAFISVAGAFRSATAGEDKAQDTYELLEANFLSVVTLARALIAPMRRRRAGNLVFTGARNVGSMIPGMSSYLASKAALHAWAGCVHEELKPHGVRVVVVTPGIIDTEKNRAAMPDADRSHWAPIPTVVEALLAGAAGKADHEGPLFDLPPQG
jgi:NAD(P)-dependent dehydrogenase (short-subunit alcohol dehydrogenase family)